MEKIISKSKISKLFALLLAIVVIGAFAGCSVRMTQNSETSKATEVTTQKETTEATSASMEDSSEATTSGEETTAESKKETSEETTEATTEATSESSEETTSESTTEATTEATTLEDRLDEEGRYTSKEDVALYIHTYWHLPSNFVTKAQARAKGWSGGSLEEYFPGCSIGGDVFGNREGLLPKKKGRTYYECDIDTKGKNSRGAKRIVFSDDGLIYYTDDHYETFTLLYGEA